MKLRVLSFVILSLGIVFGLALNSTVFEVEAKPPPEPTRGRTVLVAQNVVLNPGGIHTTGFEDTADCQSMVILAETAPVTLRLIAVLLPSVDGVTNTGSIPTVLTIDGGGSIFMAFMPGRNSGANPAVAPMVAVRFENTDAAVGVTISKAWLYCAP